MPHTAMYEMASCLAGNVLKNAVVRFSAGERLTNLIRQLS